MDCSRIPALFSAGLEQELDRSEQAAFDEHLGRCPACQRQWRLFRATVERVRALEPLVPPPDILSGIEARLAPPAPSGLPARLLDYWRRLDFSVSLPTAAATVALAMIMAFLVKNETFFQHQPAPAERQAAASSSMADAGVERFRLLRPGTTPAATAVPSGALPFDTMPAHPPAIRVPVFQRPDVLMLISAAPPEMLSQLYRQSASYPAWQVEYPERELLIVDLPSRDLATLRELLAPYPVAVAPVAALSPNFAPGKNVLRVAVRTR